MTETSDGNGSNLLVELTADIVAAYVSNHVVPVSELPALIADVHAALNNTSQPAAVVEAPVQAEKPKPPVPIRKSVQNDYIICLEDGQKFKSLKRHLMTHYGMTPEAVPREVGPAGGLSDGCAGLCRSAFAACQGNGPRPAAQRQEVGAKKLPASDRVAVVTRFSRLSQPPARMMSA